MPHETKEPFPRAFLQQALASLEKNNFALFLEKLAAVGEWIQTQTEIDRFKGKEADLGRTIQADAGFAALELTPLQVLSFEAFQLAWQDSSLVRTRSIKYVSTPPRKDVPENGALEKAIPEKGVPNTCLFFKPPGALFGQIIPLDAEGNRRASLDVSKIEDADELVQKLPGTLIDKDRENFTPAEMQFDQRLLRALKRSTLETLDQSSLAAKSQLSKELRRRVKLGMEAFKVICRLTPVAELGAGAPLSGGEEKAVIAGEPDKLHLEIVDSEPSAEELAAFPPHTYVVVRPGAVRDGRVFYCRKKNKKSKVKDEELLAALQYDQFIFALREITDAQQQALFDEKIKKLMLNYHVRHLDAQATKAIRHYHTRRQKVTRAIGNLLAALTAFAYGGVELVATIVGFFVVAGIVWTNPGLAIAGVLLLAGAVIFPFPATWANWKVFSTYVPEFFNKIRGEYNEINTKNKKALFWGLSLFALATGIAAGGLAYTATIALPAMMGLGAIGFIFPPIGVVLALAIAFSQTFMLTRNFANILRKENSWAAFKKPFLQVNKILRDTNASRARRIFIWCMVGGLTLLSVLGLAMSCFTSTRSVGKLLIDQLNTAPEKALIWGVAISAISSFFSRVYFTLDSAITSALILCKRLFKRDPRKVLSKETNQYKIWHLAEDLDPEKLTERIKPEEFNKNDKLLIISGKDPARKTVYFVKNNKLVNTEKGILRVVVKLRPQEQAVLAKAGRPLAQEQAALPSIERPDDQMTLEGDGRETFIWRALADARIELLTQETKLHPISLKKLLAIATDSVLAGGFYGQNLLSLSQQSASEASREINLHLNELSPSLAGLLAFWAFLTSGSRYVAINLKHADKPEDPYEQARQKAAAWRVARNIAFFREKNPNCAFAPASPALQQKKEDGAVLHRNHHSR